MLPRHDDMFGELRTALSGAAVWVTAQIRTTTGYILGWLTGGAQDDYFQAKIQVPHRRKLGTPLTSIHIHYLLTTLPSAGNTVILDYAYVWIQPGDIVPELIGWTQGTKTIDLTGKLANQYGLVSIVENITPPLNEGYGGMILVRVVRNSDGAGADTYTGDFGILDMDAHSQMDRLGSINEASD